MEETFTLLCWKKVVSQRLMALYRRDAQGICAVYLHPLTGSVDAYQLPSIVSVSHAVVSPRPASNVVNDTNYASASTSPLDVKAVLSRVDGLRVTRLVGRKLGAWSLKPLAVP